MCFKSVNYPPFLPKMEKCYCAGEENWYMYENEKGFRLNKQYILELVTRRGWTNRKFAILLNLDSSVIYLWINGDRPDSLVLMRGIVRLFPDEPLDMLFFRD